MHEPVRQTQRRVSKQSGSRLCEAVCESDVDSVMQVITVLSLLVLGVTNFMAMMFSSQSFAIPLLMFPGLSVHKWHVIFLATFVHSAQKARVEVSPTSA